MICFFTVLFLFTVFCFTVLTLFVFSAVLQCLCFTVLFQCEPENKSIAIFCSNNLLNHSDLRNINQNVFLFFFFQKLLKWNELIYKMVITFLRHF